MLQVRICAGVFGVSPSTTNQEFMFERTTVSLNGKVWPLLTL
jgi:hypothetical protein